MKYDSLSLNYFVYISRNGNNSGGANYENCFPMNGDFHISNGMSMSNHSTPARTQRAIFTKSSEDLLREYGLDFNKLSMVNTIDFEAPASTLGASHKLLTVAGTAATPVKKPVDKFDIFADLDPLQSSRTGQISSIKGGAGIIFDPLAPVAPPRGKKISSDNNWTTFE